MSSNNSLATALIAFASGVALGILIAPASGKEARKKLRKNAFGMKDTQGFAVPRAGDLLANLRATQRDASSDILS